MNGELERLLIEFFRTEAEFSEEDACVVVDCLRTTAFNMSVRTTCSIEDAQCILAFSFGGRHDRMFNVSIPGPQNEKIADTLGKYYESRKQLHVGNEPFCLHMCVQWEIILGSKLESIIPADQLHIFHPPVNVMSAKHDHYSTQELLEDMIQVLLREGINATQIPVGLFAHRYHLPRIIGYASSLGIVHIASSTEQMPSDFDSLSAYPWARDIRGVYLSSVISGIAKKRNELYCVDPKYFPQ